MLLPRLLPAAAIAAAAALLTGAARPESVDYRLGVEPQAGGPPVLDVELRFRGDADGETRLDLPDHFGDGTSFWKQVYGLKVDGAKVRDDGPAHRLLSHRPGAKITVRYRVSTAYAEDPQGRDGNPYRGAILRPDWIAVLGETAFATPEGRDHAAATFRWSRLPPGWTGASTLDQAPLSVDGIGGSLTLAGARLQIAERPLPGGTLRAASFAGSPFPLEALADRIARTVTAERAYWNDVQGPYFVGMVPLARNGNGRSSGGTGRRGGFALYGTPGTDEFMAQTIGHEHTHTWIPGRIGAVPDAQAEAAARFWLTEGFTDFFTTRILLRAGLEPLDGAVARMADAMRAYDASPVKTAPNSRIVADFWKDPDVEQLPYQRGQLLALKWDEDVRRKTGGKADLDDVILRMRDHYQRFPPGQGPDVVTGFVSAMWLTAGIDVRADIGRYVDGGAVIVLPDEMFDGCLQARITVTPAFDAGFDTAASFAGKVVRGVKRRGPAWNSGVRDGMALDSWVFFPGDIQSQIELNVRPPGKRAKPRHIAYWPYGDATAETRRLQLTPGLNAAQKAACGRKIGGL